MQTFQLESFPLECVRNLDDLEWSFGEWFMDRPYPVRLLAYSRAFDMRPARHLIEQHTGDLAVLTDATRALRRAVSQQNVQPFTQAAQALRALSPERQADVRMLCSAVPAVVSTLDHVIADPDHCGTPELWHLLGLALDYYSWPLPWLREAQRFYDALESHHLRRADYLMLTWEPRGISPDALALTMQGAFGRPVSPGAQLPTLLRCSYTETDLALVPDQPGKPYLAGLMSYDMRGQIDATILHDLMSRPYDVALAIDVLTRPAGRTLAATERAYAAARAAAYSGTTKDARAERQAADAEQALHELTRQNLHDVQIGVLVSGETREDLETHVAEVSEALGSRLRLTRPPGIQRQLLSLWSTRPAKDIDLPWQRRNVYSKGVGCLAGVLTYHRPANTDGLLWGIDAQRQAPLMLDLFANRQAAHMVVLGKTGYGKTYFLNVVALRAAALAGYRVIMVDAFENAARIERAIGPGARANWLSLETPINILDIVFQDDGDDWRAGQIEHVISQLAMLMGTLGTSSQGQKHFEPRIFTPEERGVLDAALSTLYEDYTPDVPLSEMPLLEDLIAVLDEQGQPEGMAIATTLRKLLFGTDARDATRLTRLGQRFNATTTIDWRFERAVTSFDLSQITRTAPEWLPFYYAQVIGAINRYMRDPNRDRSVPTMLIIDEFGYAAQVESVARLAADICKVARKYGIGLMVVDQNPLTFGTAVGKEIIENAVAKILFHLDDSAAQVVDELMSELTPGHVAFLPKAERGQTVAVFGNNVHFMNIEASALEHRQFSRS